MKSKKGPRPGLADRTKLQVWAAAAGRCTFCNCLVLENEVLGLEVPIGELAHNVGWSENSPRGESDLSEDVRRQADNLLLLCRNCHKPADDGGVLGLYTVEELARRKRDHETRVRLLTDIGADRSAMVIRVVGPVRGVSPHLDYDAVLEATTGASLFPQQLPGRHRSELELDLRSIAEGSGPDYFAICAQQIDVLAARISDGVRRDEIRRLAVFAFARIPLLIHLGARLDDKVPTIVFQRQRNDRANAWRWPDIHGEPPEFEHECLRQGNGRGGVVLTVNLSGSIALEELPADAVRNSTIYELRPVAPARHGPQVIDSLEALAAFEDAARRFLADVEHLHGKPERVALFPAVPVAAAVTLGRVLMPGVSPAWSVYDRDQVGKFSLSLEVRR
jgi:hypothetical protein